MGMINGLVSLLVTGLAIAAWFGLSGLGVFNEIEEVGISECKRFKQQGESLYGVEDSQYDPESGLVFLSVAQTKPMWFVDSSKEVFDRIDQQGAIKVYNPQARKVTKLNLDLGTLESPHFHPHGIYYFAPTKKLFVVNHHKDGDSVEIFQVDLEELALTYVTRFMGHHFNDVVAYDEDHVFVTSMMGSESVFERYVELIFDTKRSYVSMCTHTKATGSWACEKAAEGIGMANGIGLDPTKQHLYVNGYREHNLLMYTISDELKLTLKHKIHLGRFCDNMDVHPVFGFVITGCQGKLAELFTHIPFPENHGASSQVFLVTKPWQNSSIPKLLYSSHGVEKDGDQNLPAVTGAIFSRTQAQSVSPLSSVLLNSLNSEGFLECDFSRG